LASDKILKKVRKVLGKILIKTNKFPLAIRPGETVEGKLNEVKSTVKFQLKKVTCLATAIGQDSMSEE